MRVNSTLTDSSIRRIPSKPRHLKRGRAFLYSFKLTHYGTTTQRTAVLYGNSPLKGHLNKTQSNLSNTDTEGRERSVHIREVHVLERSLC